MINKIECEIWIAMDEDGNWRVSKEQDDVISDISDERGLCIRTARVTVKMAPPQVAEFEVDIPDDPSETEEEEKAAA